MNVIGLFLTLFQAERPLNLFLHEHLKKLIISLMDRFVRPAVLESASSFKQGESFAWWKYWCRFWVNQSIQEIESGSIPLSPKFQKEGLKFCSKVDGKAQGWSPSKYSLPLYLGSLSPSIISTHKTELLVNRLKKLLECLHESGWISSDTADQAKY